MVASARNAARQEPIGPALVLVLVGAMVALTLGIYGHVHDKASQRSTMMGFWTIDFETSTQMLQFKSWFTMTAVALAFVQLLTGLRLFDRISWPRQIPLWLGDFHRLCGTLVLVFSLPVAYHCLWSLGFQTESGMRVWIHSLFGCFFYGVYVTKVLAVRRHDTPSWFIPVMGGTVLVVLVVVWLSSAVFYFAGQVG